MNNNINKETLKKISIITFVAAITLIVGGTLAIFNFDTLFEGLSTNKISTCKLGLNVKDDNSITLVEAYPISDEKANEYTPYTFTITNKSDCKETYYKITLGDICTTCTKTNDICTVNGQELNCSSAYKISSSKIKYQLVNKNTNEVVTNVNPENIELIGQIAKDEAISFELKLWIDSSATNEDVYVYENGKPKENSDGSIVTKNVGYKLNVEGQNNSEFINNLDTSGANAPLLTSNMIPVYYDDTSSSWKKADSKNQNESYKWYDYDQKMWANAVTVTETNRTTYLNASAGTEIPMSDINTMWVWIPRYKYTYFASDTPVEIPITFEKGTESTGTIKCVDAISANSGKSENCTDTKNGSITKGTSTYTHPAFTFGSDELTGLWVGKFELGGTLPSTLTYLESDDNPKRISNINENEKKQIIPLAGDIDAGTTASCENETCDISNMVIIPDTIALGSEPVSSLFYAVRSMQQTNNPYGFSTNESLNTHMIKNTEWGVVAYLSHSKYGTCKNGRCSEIDINENSEYYTGNGVSVPSEIVDEGNATNRTYKYNEIIIVSSDIPGEDYKTVGGVLASTTHNIYGVYDMSGGKKEYTMANMYNESNTFNPKEADNWSSSTILEDKYHDKYSYGSETTRGKLGDATIEMQPTGSTSWYGDNVYHTNDNMPWVSRGARSDEAEKAGVFSIEGFAGRGLSYYTSRASLSIKK